MSESLDFERQELERQIEAERRKLYSAARDFALRRLDRRECSSQDIYRHLLKKKVSPEVSSKVVSDLVVAGVINDERFAKMLTREQATRGKGPQLIRQKLRAKGISLSVEQIQAIRGEVTQISELDTALALLERKYDRESDNPNEIRRAFQALVRRGFSFALAQEAVRRWKKP